MRRLCLFLFLVTILMTFLAGDVVFARPQYAVVFSKTYSVQHNGGKVSCRVCHPSRSKKVRNHYAVAFSKELENKNERDEDVIVRGLRKIEDGRCGPQFKTWGELLKAGYVPCPHGEPGVGYKSWFRPAPDAR